DGTEIEGGWLDGNWAQVGYQAVDTVAGVGWSFIVTFVILYGMNKIPGLSLRVKIEKERVGLDQTELGMGAYEHVNELATAGEVNKNNEKRIQAWDKSSDNSMQLTGL
ncbi:unnamed protein product, partial [Allacma fusca]